MNDRFFIILILISFIFLSVLYNYDIENFIDINKKIVFLHIPKNAGTSFKKTYPHVISRKHNNSFPDKKNINIAIIRNPYTRLQSIFSHIKYRSDMGTCDDLNNFDDLDDLCVAYYNNNHKYHKQAKKLLKWDDNKILSYRHTKYHKYNNGCPKNKTTNSYLNELGCIHWAPQYLYLNNGNYIDYILRFEKLDKDINKLITLNILDKSIEKHKVSFNKYKKKTEITYNVKKLVEDVYKKDLKLWKSL